MSDTKYNFDEYIFDNVLEDTYLAIKDVRENIDRWVKETREIDFDYNPYEGRDEREKLDGVITKNIVNSIKDRLYNVDFENKVMRGVNVEAVRDIVGPQVFDDFFQTDVILPKPMNSEVAVQLLSPSESVKYCARFDEPYYPKAFSKLMLKSTVDTLCDLYKSGRYGFDILSSAFGNLADHIHEAKQVAEDLSYDVGAPKHFDDCIQYLKEKTEGFVLFDKAWERIGGKQFDVPQKKRLDLSQFYGENKYSDGTDMELGD